jgi:outer membrane lipoprotein-sorting protein
MFSIAFNAAGDKFRPVKDVDTFKEKIQTYTSENTSIQSDFIQEKHLTILEEVLISKGHFSFQKENNVRWEYNEPIDYAIIVYNGLFTIWDGKKIQEYNIESNRMFSEINNMIVTSVSGNFLDNPDFESDYFENDTYYLIKLTPLKPEVNDMLSGIEIYFDKSNFSVSKVIFNEPGDDYTLISFSNIKFNQEIPAQVFKTDFD